MHLRLQTMRPTASCVRVCMSSFRYSYAQVRFIYYIYICLYICMYVARLAGVRPSFGVGCVQRGHQQMEHRLNVNDALGMRRFRPAARTAANALGRSWMWRGRRSRWHRRCACVSAHTCTGTRLRGCPRVHVWKRFICLSICLSVYLSIYLSIPISIYTLYIYTYTHTHTPTHTHTHTHTYI